MIKEQTPLTYAEVLNLIGDGEKAQKIKEFIKEFYELKSEKAIELKEALKALDILKLKEEHLTNIVNFLPQDASDLLKILSDASLDQEEVTKILEVVKKY